MHPVHHCINEYSPRPGWHVNQLSQYLHFTLWDVLIRAIFEWGRTLQEIVFAITKWCMQGAPYPPPISWLWNRSQNFCSHPFVRCHATINIQLTLNKIAVDNSIRSHQTSATAMASLRYLVASKSIEFTVMSSSRGSRKLFLSTSSHFHILLHSLSSVISLHYLCRCQ